MLKQEFTFKEFSYLIRRGDYFSYFKPDIYEEKVEEIKNTLLQQVESRFFQNTDIFSTLKCVKLKNKDTYILEKIKSDKSNLIQRVTDDFILRKVNKNLRRVYGVRQADRYKIIKNVQNLLSEQLPFFVCKTDIRHFYESIDRDKILSDIKNSSILSFDTKCVIEKLFSHPLIENTTGLPRGINISATLSEYFMRSFDREIRKIKGVYYYARFVDDIIIFSTEEITKDTLTKISTYLPKGLRLNSQKTKVVKFSNTVKELKIPVEITFLGYKFVRYVETIFNKKKNNQYIRLRTTISPKKIKKMKERIVKAFLSFKHHQDMTLLKDRLLFLTANYPLKTIRQEVSKYEKVGCLHGGIAYNYPLINDTSCLKELDTFLYQVINTSAFAKININFTQEQKAELRKYSFFIGYQRRISRKFKLDRLSQIIECWE